MPLEAARVLAWGQSEVAGEVPSGGKTPDIPDEAHERRRAQQPDTGDSAQVFDRGKLLGDCLQLPFDLLDSTLDLADLATGLGEDWSPTEFRG